MLRLHAARLYALLTTLALPACGEPPDATTEATADGSGSGSGTEEVATCWLDGVPVEKCPVQPRGNLPADCPSGRVFESPDFAPGTGPCVPSMPDWDCPEGWRSVPGFTDGSGNEDVPEGMTQFSICEPPEGSAWVGAPEGSGVGAPELPPTPTDCPDGTIAVPGDAACRPMGSPCPTAAERWASEADLRARAPGYDGPVVYVASDAAADGAGTRDAPKPLTTAIMTASSGSILALALGTYDEAVSPSGVALVGACVAGTEIAPSAVDTNRGAVSLSGSAATLVANLTVSGNHQGIVTAGAGSGISPKHQVRDAVIRGVLNRGLQAVSGSAVEIRMLRVEGTRPNPVDETLGRGIQAQNGASLSLTDVSLSNNHDVGLFAFDAGTSVTATRMLVAATQPKLRDQTAGRGIQARNGATLVLTDVVARQNHETGVYALGAGTSVTATRLRVEETQPDASDQTLGWGIDAEGGATLALSEVTLSRNHAIGLTAEGADTSVTATQLLVEDTLPDASDQTAGWGVQARDGATLTISLAELRGNHDVGLFAADAGTSVSATDLLVEETQPQASDQTAGWGVAGQDGATITLSDVTLLNNHEIGLFAVGAGTAMTATGLLVQGTRPRARSQTFGRGIDVSAGATLNLEYATVRQNHDVGLALAGRGTQLRALGLVVEDTQPQVSDRSGGRGVNIQDGASVIIESASLHRNRDVGLAVIGSYTQARVSGLLVEDTQPQVSDQSGGSGVKVRDGANLTVSHARLRNNHEFGLFAGDSGSAVTATVLLVEDTQPDSSYPTGGWGIAAIGGVALTLTDAILRNNHELGMLAASFGTRVTASGLVVEKTLPSVSALTNGMGISVVDGAVLTLTGATLRSNHAVGLIASDAGTRVTATVLLVERTKPRAIDQSYGVGVGVQDGAALTLAGATLRANHDVGLLGLGVGTTVTATGLLVADTQPQARDGRFGDGLLLTEGASLTGADITLWENARCGLQVAFEGVSVAVQGALIGRNLIGTNLQSSDFTRDDLAVGLRGETYLENGLDLGAETLPIPDPLEAIESLEPIAP